MNKNALLHVALQYTDEEKADIFFGKVLNMEVVREFTLAAGVSDAIFGIRDEVKVKTYADSNITFEIFFTKIIPKIGYEHICISVGDKKNLIEKCRKYGIEIVCLNMKNKEYLFMKDYSGYVYEIK